MDFLQVVCEMRNGRNLTEIDKRFQKLREAVLEQRAKGSLTIKLDMIPAAVDADRGVTEVRIEMDVVSKLPEKNIQPGQFFITKEGALSRKDPDQADLFEGAE